MYPAFAPPTLWGMPYEVHLVQILLPLQDNRNEPFAPELFTDVAAELTRRFGGLTAYTRSPATGLWQEDATRTVRDDVVVYEVMVETLDRPWWAAYRETLREAFAQDELVVRTHPVERL